LPILIVAYRTGKLKGEIVNLKWDGSDLKMSSRRVLSENIKKGKVRGISLNKELTGLVKSIINLQLDGHGERSVIQHLNG